MDAGVVDLEAGEQHKVTAALQKNTRASCTRSTYQQESTYEFCRSTEPKHPPRVKSKPSGHSEVSPSPALVVHSRIFIDTNQPTFVPTNSPKPSSTRFSSPLSRYCRCFYSLCLLRASVVCARFVPISAAAAAAACPRGRSELLPPRAARCIGRA